MKQTLFEIPLEFFSTWGLGLWLFVGLAFFVWHAYRGTLRQRSAEFVPLFLIVAGILYFVLPILSVPSVNPADPLGDLVAGGLKIRGYGLFMMLAILSAIGLVVWRCRANGLAPEPYVNLCFVMIVSGLVGARLFYVIQKWPEFVGLDPLQSLRTILDMTKGGLVVYGSLIGGLIGASVFLWRRKMNCLSTLDLLAPAMIWGLAVGRIGCLMNGCCFGGVCGEEFPLGIRFPAGTAPYQSHWMQGRFLGLEGSWNEHHAYPLLVTKVEPHSLGADMGIQPGDEVRIPLSVEPERLQFLQEKQIEVEIPIVIESRRSGTLERRVPLTAVPQRSLKIHPTQLYAAFGALLVWGVLWFYYPFRQFDGEVISMLLVMHAVSRFLEEAIRVDELGIWGTSLSIGQWVSLAILGSGTALYCLGRVRSPQHTRVSG